jgi:hypothetical protein
MQRASLGAVELDHEISGTAEPVVVVHHGAGRNWFDALLEIAFPTWCCCRPIGPD